MDTIHSIWLALLGTGICFAGTAVGAAAVFFTKKELNNHIQKLFLGFAAGVMIAASVFSLLIPAIEAGGEGTGRWLPPAAGFLAGALFLYMFDKLISRWKEKRGGHGLSSSGKLIFAVTLHNFPEGMAVGLSFALAGITGSGVTLLASLMLAAGIAIQNIPEGAVISLPLKGEGYSKGKAFLIGALSGAAEPLAGVISAALAAAVAVILPWALSFAAGAMLYVVIEELAPGAKEKKRGLGTVGAMLGFVLMMTLDVALG